MLTWLQALTGSCLACDSDWPDGDGLCLSCRTSLYTPLVLPGLVALGYYQGRLRQAVRALKFAGGRRLAVPLGQRLAELVDQEAWKVDCVTYVPMSIGAKRRRGFDQANALAAVVASILDRPLLGLLGREAGGSKQSRLDPLERIANAYRSYGPARRFSPRRVLLVDDVYTTGATMSACRDALIEIGATDVMLAVVALAPKRSPLALVAKEQESDGRVTGSLARANSEEVSSR